MPNSCKLLSSLTRVVIYARCRPATQQTTSQNLISKGVVIDKLLDSLIVTNGVKQEHLVLGDKNAVLVAARILGYGKEYQFTYDGEEQTTDLSKLDSKKMDFSKLARGMNEFSFELPNSKRTITFKLPPVNNGPIPQNTKGIATINKNILANNEDENFLNEPSILIKLFYCYII